MSYFNGITSWFSAPAVVAPPVQEEVKAKGFFRSLAEKFPKLSLPTSPFLEEVRGRFQEVSLQSKDALQLCQVRLAKVHKALTSLELPAILEVKEEITLAKQTLATLKKELTKKMTADEKTALKVTIHQCKASIVACENRLTGLLYSEAKNPNRKVVMTDLIDEIYHSDDDSEMEGIPTLVSLLRKELLQTEKEIKAEMRGLSSTSLKVNALIHLISDKVGNAYFLQSALVYSEKPLSKWGQFEYEYKQEMEAKRKAGAPTSWAKTAPVRAKDDFKKAIIGAPSGVMDAFGKASNRVDSLLIKGHEFTRGINGGISGFIAGIGSFGIGGLRIAAKVTILGIGVLMSLATFLASTALVTAKWSVASVVALVMSGGMISVLTISGIVALAGFAVCGTVNLTYALAIPIITGIMILAAQIGSFGALGAYFSYKKGEENAKKMIESLQTSNLGQSVEYV